MKQNITLSVDREVIRKVRVLAAQRQTSVSGLLSQELIRIVDREERYERAKAAALRNIRRGFHWGDTLLGSREELHER